MKNFSQKSQTTFMAIVLFISIVLLCLAGTELKWKTGAGFHLQPGMWSILGLSGMVLFSLLKVLQFFLPFSKSTKLSLPGKLELLASLKSWFGPLEFLAYFLIYVTLVPWLGYLPSSVLVFPLLVYRAGYRGRKYFALSIFVAVTIVLLFKSLLQVKIPGGELYSLFPDQIRNFFVLWL